MADGDRLRGVARGLLAGINTGSAAFARGNQSEVARGQLALDRERLELQSDKFKQAVKQQAQETSVQMIDELVASLSEAVKVGTISPENIDQVLTRPGVATLLNRAGEGLQRNPEEIAAFVKTRLLGAATPQQQGAAEGQTTVAAAEAITGQPLTDDQREQAAGVAPDEPQIAELINLRDKLIAEGRATDAASVQNQIDKIGTIVGRTPEDVGLTTGSQTKVQGAARSSSELLTNLGALSDQLDDGDVVGAPAAFRGFLNKTLAQFSPALFDPERADFEQLLKTTRQSALRAISDESRFSEADRDFIFELFPETGAFESRENAEAKLRVLTAFFLRRLGRDLESLGAESSVPTLTMDDVVEMVAAGNLTKEEGFRVVETLGIVE